MFSFPVKLYLKFRYETIQKILKDPKVTQINQLHAILQELAATSFGHDHKLSPEDNYDEFNKKVPVRTYEDIFPYIQRMLDGESNVLWHGMINMFATSSGTTNAKVKYLPVSNESHDTCHYGGIQDMLALYANAYPETKIFDGKSIGVSGVIETKNDITIGDISAIMCAKSPWWAEIARTPSKDIALSSDLNEKLKNIAEVCVYEDVRMLAGAPTWISIILKRIEENKNITDFWPNLELIAHGGVAFEPYRELLKKQLSGKNINFWQSYNASEGFFASQDEKDSNDMLLLINNGVFYEFIPTLEYQQGSLENIIPLSEVTLDTDYALIITTNSGLIRYVIGDTVKFTNLKPHKIQITGRTKFFINAFGEDVIVDNTNKAIAYAQEKTNSLVHNYTAAPVFMESGKSGHYKWYIEFEKMPQDPDTFIEYIDTEMRNLNSNYNTKRSTDGIIGKPTMQIVPSGTFLKWLQGNNKYGAQSKIPPLSKDSTICDEIDEILKKD